MSGPRSAIGVDVTRDGTLLITLLRGYRKRSMHTYLQTAFDSARMARIALQVGGTYTDCKAHISAVKQHPVLQGGDIDFKLSHSNGAANEDCRKESAFDTLVVRQVDELVTLGPRAQGHAHVCNGGAHLTPQAFHEALAACDTSQQDTVILDARNIYESRIGRFEVVRSSSR